MSRITAEAAAAQEATEALAAEREAQLEQRDADETAGPEAPTPRDHDAEVVEAESLFREDGWRGVCHHEGCGWGSAFYLVRDVAQALVDCHLEGY